MDKAPYNAWVNLYNKDIECVWYSQHVELRKAAMLLQVLENEFKKIYKNAENNFKFWEQKTNNEKYENNLISKHLDEEKENTISNTIDACKAEGILNSNLKEVPIHSKESLHIPLSTSQDDANRGPISPKINRYGKLSMLKKVKHCNGVNYSLLKNQIPVDDKIYKQNDIIDSTIIQRTPEILSTPKKAKHIKSTMARKKNKLQGKLNEGTLTQMFSKIPCSTMRESARDSTYCSKESEIACPVTSNQNETEKPKQCNFVFKEPVVRGKARLQLEGWDCADCKMFYENLDLNSQQTKQMLNKCSKHRSKFKPYDFTPKGFWDLNFPATPETEKDSSDSACFQY